MTAANTNDSKQQPHINPVVGRDRAIDLDKYTVLIHGRSIVDYDKLRREEPELYSRILREEIESDRADERQSRR